MQIRAANIYNLPNGRNAGAYRARIAEPTAEWIAEQITAEQIAKQISE